MQQTDRSPRHLRALVCTLALLGILGSQSLAHAGDEPVLLVHGFMVTNSADCVDYFDGQLGALQHELKPREVRTIGWYDADTRCDDYIPGVIDNDRDTPIAEIAYELFQHVYIEYSRHGQAVDIVAHSLGGLVVRKMIDEYGYWLRVDDVVTLGTPHAGVGFTWPVFAGCGTIAADIGQCAESEAGSDFITDLAENPQSAIPTKWTLIGTKNDGVVGPDTSIDMSRVSTSRPSVSTYQYPAHIRDDSDCFGYAPLGHGDLVRDRPTGRCTYSWAGWKYDSLENPTDRVLDALD